MVTFTTYFVHGIKVLNHITKYAFNLLKILTVKQKFVAISFVNKSIIVQFIRAISISSYNNLMSINILALICLHEALKICSGIFKIYYLFFFFKCKTFFTGLVSNTHAKNIPKWYFSFFYAFSYYFFKKNVYISYLWWVARMYYTSLQFIEKEPIMCGFRKILPDVLSLKFCVWKRECLTKI